MTSPTVLTPFPAVRHDHARCVHAALARAEGLCHRRGTRLTRLRRRVLELVWESHRPVKAYDLLEELRRDHRGAAPPTVYRALDFLLSQGLVHRLESLNAFVGCGGPERTHAGQFLICTGCEAVAELSDPEVAEILARQASALGFSLGQQTIELEGVCPSCRGGAVD